MSFHPHHILPYTTPRHQQDRVLDSSTHGVFLSGPLSSSSLLHLALNHLLSDPTEENSRGKGKGKGKAKQQEQDQAEEEKTARHVLILTPDRDALREALRKENDLSLFGRENVSQTMRLLERVEIKYLPTNSTFTYGLMTLHSQHSPATAHQAFQASGSKLKADPSYLPILPTLVILHNPSVYLSEDSNTQGGIETYASLLALFLSTFSSFSPRPNLIVHDMSASQLELPVTASHLKRPGRKRSRDPLAEEEVDEVERTSLEAVAEFFFDCLGKVQLVPNSPSSVFDPGEQRYTFTLRTTGHGEGIEGEEVALEYWVRNQEVEVGLDGSGEMETDVGLVIERIS